ncbi:MAG TPA: hypothetical protein VG755_28230 [Nannocystaceae bacterium]|nr:hypothetical protein [Nannocystaceae bacterium]
MLVLAALLCPALAQAAEPRDNAKLVADAKASPLFKKSIKRNALKKHKLESVTVAAGVNMDLRRYLRETALDTQPELKPLLDPALRPDALTGAPTYVEDVLVLEDRLVIDRRLTVPLAPGACTKPVVPDAIAKLCFMKNAANKPTKAIAKELKDIRAKLAKADKGQIVRGTVTAGEAAAMNDEQLLDLLLNGEGRTIHHVSIVPRVALPPGIKPVLGALDAALAAGAADTGLGTGYKFNPGAVATEALGGGRTFATDYFLTGFTYGKELEDSWEYTIAGATWLTDRYYIHLGYHLSLGFGVRAPFSVAVKSSGTPTNKQVSLAVEPVNVDEQGSPAYGAVGLPQNKYFDGKEFVLQFTAGCELYVSIPGPNIDKRCPSIDKSWSRDINPVIGSESSAIADWWLDGSITGLQLNLAAVKATLDVGLGADVTNGKIGVTMTGIDGAALGNGGGAVMMDSRAARVFTMTRAAEATGAKLRLEDPRYAFDLRLRPKLRGKIDLDVSIYEHQWILGPFPLDFLAVAKTFNLTRHDGTVANHDYAVFDGDNPGAVMDPNIGGATVDPNAGDPGPKKSLGKVKKKF